MTTTHVASAETSRAQATIPWVPAILCIVVPIIPTVSVLPGPLRGHGSPARLLAYVCVALVIVGFVKARKFRTGTSPNAGALLMVAFLLLQLLAYAVGTLEVGNAVVESSKTRTALITLADAGVALYIIRAVRTARDRSIVLGCLVSGLAFACAVGVLQGATPFDFRFALVPPGFVSNLEAAGLDARGAAVRVVGTSDHAIEFAVVAAITVPLAMHLARFASTPIRRQLSTICCILAFMAVPLAVSRTGVVAILAALLVYVFSMNIRLLGNALIVGAGILLLYKIAFPGPLNSLLATITGSGTDSSILSRTDDYAAVGEQFHKDPMFGLGLGAYPPTEYRFLDNQWLQAVVQGGIVGLTAMIVLTIGAALGIASGLRSAEDKKERDQIYAIGAAVVGLLASSATFDMFTFQQATFIFFILYGLLWASRPTRRASGVLPVDDYLRR